MSDFEDRVARALGAGAEGAPGVVVGLADGARLRARDRRRRRTSVGAVAAVLAVVVPLAIVQDLGDGPDRRLTGTTDPGWQTVSVAYERPPQDVEETLLVDVPETWVAIESDDRCPGFYDYGAPDRIGPCEEAETMSVVVDRGSLDYVFGPGLRPASDYENEVDTDWLGHVSLDGVDVSVYTDDQQVALRVLASAHTPEQEPLDLSEPWSVAREDGLAYPVPGPLAGPVELTTVSRREGESSRGPEEVSPGRWTAVGLVDEDRWVQATAASSALAQVVAGSARSDSWQRVVLFGDLYADVPQDWMVLEPRCGPGVETLIGPPGSTCDDGPRVSAFTGNFDTAVPAGDIGVDGGGHVDVGGVNVFVQGTDFTTSRRLLASVGARTGSVEVAGEWTARTVDGVQVEVPVEPVEVIGTVGTHDAPVGGVIVRGRPGRWTGSRAMEDGTRFEVVAPTVALAQVVGASARSVRAPADGAWETVVVDEIVLEVPTGWRRVECPVSDALLLPVGTDSCGPGAPRIYLLAEASTRWPGPGLSEDSGSVQAGRFIVSAENLPSEDVRRILASARTAGDPAPDVASWRRVDLGEGMTAEVPSDPRVEVDYLEGLQPYCAGEVNRARQLRTGWSATLCRDRIVTVTAPTQALADVVALQVRGY